MVSQRNGLEFPLSLSCLAVGLSKYRRGNSVLRRAQMLVYTSGAFFKFQFQKTSVKYSDIKER